MSRGCTVSKNMQSGLWLRFPEILSRSLALGISLVLRAASLMLLKRPPTENEAEREKMPIYRSS